MKFQYLKNERNFTLVELREIFRSRKAVFITVSPNPKKSHEVVRIVNGKNKKSKPLYGLMSHKEQYEYLEKYMKSVFIDLLDPEDIFYYVYEFNKEGNLHTHALLYTASVQSDIELKMLRKEVASLPAVIFNMAKTKNGAIPKDYMNNIVFCDDNNKTLEYLNKDISIKSYFPDTLYGVNNAVEGREDLQRSSLAKSNFALASEDRGDLATAPFKPPSIKKSGKVVFIIE